MSITYEDIRERVEAGETPEQITAAVNADARTVKPIELGELLDLLNRRKMLVRLIRPADTGEKWTGTVVNMILHVNDAAAGTPLADAVNQWFSHITNDRNSVFDTTDATFAGQLALLATQFADQPNMPTAADFESITELGGGRRVSDVTQAEVEATIDDAAVSQSKASVVQSCKDQIDAIWSPMHQRRSAVHAWLSSLNLNTMTVEDIQAFCDDLMSTEDGNPSDYVAEELA